MSPEGFLFLFASFLSFATGLAHSVFGERLIFMRPHQSDLPVIYGQPDFTIRVLRASWHCVTIAVWATSVLFFLMAQAPITAKMVSSVLGSMFFVMAFEILIIVGGRYLIWSTLIIISLIAFWCAYQL